MPWPLKLRETPDNEWPDDRQTGDTFRFIHHLVDGSTKECWYVVLPNGHLWNVYGSSGNGTGWQVSGDPPNIDVSPSILVHGITGPSGETILAQWHGWIRHGVIVEQ